MIKSNKKSRRGCICDKGENDMVTRCIAVVEDSEDSFERLRENLDGVEKAARNKQSDFRYFCYESCSVRAFRL